MPLARSRCEWRRRGRNDLQVQRCGDDAETAGVHWAKLGEVKLVLHGHLPAGSAHYLTTFILPRRNGNSKTGRPSSKLTAVYGKASCFRSVLVPLRYATSIQWSFCSKAAART